MTTDLKTLWAQPDGTIETMRGHDWTRTHAKRCPHCGDVFYGLERVDMPFQPHAIDPEPPMRRGMSIGLRGTCGARACRDAEEHHQALRSPKTQVILQKARAK